MYIFSDNFLNVKSKYFCLFLLWCFYFFISNQTFFQLLRSLSLSIARCVLSPFSGFLRLCFNLFSAFSKLLNSFLIHCSLCFYPFILLKPAFHEMNFSQLEILKSLFNPFSQSYSNTKTVNQ